MSLRDKFLQKEPSAEHMLICKSLTNMLKAEKILSQKEIPLQLMPVPRGYGSPCRTAIIFPSVFKLKVEQLINENQVAWQGIYPIETPARKKDWSEVFKFSFREDFAAIMEKARLDIALSREDLIRVLATEDTAELGALFTAANLIRQECTGERVDIRAAIEFSNYCRRNCKYCGLRRDNKQLTRYRMSPEEILAAVEEVADMGLKTVILQSGEDPWYTKDIITALIKEIKSRFGLRITLSIGEREPEEYLMFRKAGANNYLLKIETADRSLFSDIHPDDIFDHRVECLTALKKAGFLLGSGDIVGLPGQKLEQLAEDIIFCKEKGIHMIGTGPFIPADNTPFATEPAGSVDMTLKMTALYRIVCQNVYIPATTALATLDKEGLAKGLKAGANTVMLIMTPARYRSNYNIYNSKKPVGLVEVLEVIEKTGRKYPVYLEKRVKGRGESYA